MRAFNAYGIVVNNGYTFIDLGNDLPENKWFVCETIFIKVPQVISPLLKHSSISIKQLISQLMGKNRTIN